MKFRFLSILLFILVFETKAQPAPGTSDTIYYVAINKNAYAGRVNGQGCFTSLISIKKRLYYYHREISIYYPSGLPMIYGRTRGKYCVGIWVYTEDISGNVVKFRSLKKRDKVMLPRTMSGYIELFQ